MREVIEIKELEMNRLKRKALLTDFISISIYFNNCFKNNISI